jgi:hypothetical protein
MTVYGWTVRDRSLQLAGCDLEAVLAIREIERPDPAPDPFRIETSEPPSDPAPGPGATDYANGGGSL